MSQSSGEQRWEIEFDHQKGMIALGPVIPDLRGSVEVMPVAEHEREMAALRLLLSREGSTE